MKVAVFGNRDIEDEKLVLETFKYQLQLKILEMEDLPHVTLLHGGAAGPPKYIAQAYDGLFDIVVFKPWSMIWKHLHFSPLLFFYRNKQIVENADIVYIFTNNNPDSEVNRTRELCVRMGKEFYVINVEDLR